MLRFPTWKIALVLGICVLGLVYALPNLFPRAEMERMPDWLPHEQINLGLDLQGGSHLLLEVDTQAVVHERLETLVDDVRVTLRRRDLPSANSIYLKPMPTPVAAETC
jgi:preprotein translocase subunit SecD